MNMQPTRRQKGQAIVLVALMIVALTGMLALTVDVGNSYTQRRLLQTAADAAAMAGAHQGMEQILNAGGTQNYATQRATAIKFANMNGASGSDTITIVWVDNTGTAFANSSNLPVVPAGKVVQGMKVTISGNRNTFLFRALGIQTVGVTVTAMAQFGTANALVGASPLLMNNDTLGSGGLKPTLYVPFLVMTDSGGPSCCTAGQSDSFGNPIPAAFLPPNTVSGPNNFHVLHDPPTDPVKLATRSSAANGVSGTLSIGPSYYIESSLLDDQFALGLYDRILRSNANPVFAGDKPQAGKFSPYNPRVFMTAVNASSSGTTPTTIVVFLAFYMQFVIYDASHHVTIGGYWVNSAGVPGSGGLGLPTNGTGDPMVFRLTQ